MFKEVSGPLTAEAAEAVVRKLDPRAAVGQVAEVVERTGGQLSAVYEVRCTGPGQTLIVKVYDEQWRWKQEKEVHVYRLLASNGIGQIPSILLSQAAGGPHDRAFTVMSHLEGQPLSEVAPVLDVADRCRIYRQMGVWLASVHRIGQAAYGYVTTEITEPTPTNASYMSRQFATKLDDFAALGGDTVLLAAMRKYVANRSDTFVQCPAPVLCHNDLHEGNVLIRQSASGWAASGFIDVENAIAADPLLDLAKTEYYAIGGDDVKRRAFLDGYGALPANGLDRLAVYQLYHAVDLWVWFTSIGNSGPLSSISRDIQRLLA